MSVLDDLIASGLTLVQAQAVIDEDSTGDNTDGLVVAGFWGTQAEALHAYDADATDAKLDACTQQGIWAGATLAAVKAALDVTP